MLRECAFGITSEWPRVHGLMSMKARVLSSSSILCDGISPATILQKMQSGSLISEWRLQPLDALEVDVQAGGEPDHDRNRERVPVLPLQLRHVLEVHPVDAGDQRRHRENRRPRGDGPHLLVLPD